MKFSIKNLSNELIDIFNFPKNKTFEHSESLGFMEYFEGCQSPEHIHCFVFAIVDTVIGIFIKNIQNRDHQIFPQVLIHFCRK